MKNILFNVEMTKAILDGRKVQTRRVIKNPSKFYKDKKDQAIRVEPSNTYWYKDRNYCIRDNDGGWMDFTLEDFIKHCGGYQIGETIWVREPVQIMTNWNAENIDEVAQYKADGLEFLVDSKNPEIYRKCYTNYPKWFSNCQGMPNGCIKEMARIFLKITNVRVQRLQDISEEDCVKEGVFKDLHPTEDGEAFMFFIENSIATYYNAQSCFECEVWNKTALKGYKWEDNPYVFVYEFERVENEN